jgi:uncharacterized protein YciI
MLFAIYAIDNENVAPIRKEHYPAHYEFLKNQADYGISITMSGPLVADDGVTPVGSLLIVEAADRETAENFSHSDPFYKADVWKTVDIKAFVRKN